MSIPALSIRNPVLVNLVMILLIVAGIFSYMQMPQDRFPDVSTQTIMVTTVMPGASPKEIEQLITIPMEEEISKVDEIDEMTSVSSDGSSTIVLEMESSVDNMFEKLTEIQNQIEMVEDFPDEAENPVVREMKVSFETLTFAILGQAPERELKEFVEDIESDIKLIPGVEEVDISGIREREIWVEVEPSRLHSYGLSLADVSMALRLRNLNLPGGTIKMGRGEFNVRTESEFGNIEDVLNTVLTEDGENGFVYVRDVATVKDTFEEPTRIARLNGTQSVLVTIKKDKGSNAIKLVERIRSTLDRYESRLPAGTSFKIVSDASEEIADRLTGLYQNLGLGLALCVVSFTLFIGFRAALIVSLGIPVAFFTTFTLISWYGFSVNMLVLFSLILVLGLVVDDAIVVCENIYRHLEAGMGLQEAAVKGTEEITWPVVATVLTTVAAFLPLLIMTGVLGEFMGVIPVVVSFALAASLFECLFILPAHVAEFGVGKKRDSSGSIQKRRGWLVWMTNIYSNTIRLFLKMRYAMLVLVFASALFALNLAWSHMDFILFGGRDLQSFSLSVEAASGASIFETSRILGDLEDSTRPIFDGNRDIKNVHTRVGALRRSSFMQAAGSNVGEINFELIPTFERTRSGHDIKDEIREAVANVPGARSMVFEDTREGPPVGKAVQVRIKGDNFDTLKKISLEVQEYLKTLDGIKDVMDNFPPGKDEVRPVLDLENVAALGLDVRTIATEIRGAFEGIESTKVHDGNEEIDVMVKYNEANRSSLADLESMYFSTPEGMTPFSNFGVMERRQGYASISHHEQKRAVNVLADVVEGSSMTSVKANQLIIKEFADLSERYPGYALDFGGEFLDTRESLNSMLRSFGITLILIYVILGGLFKSFVQPLIVMFAVPFSFVGVVVGFFIMDEPLGMFSIIGIIALCGIVVNDSLILIEFINARRRLGVERRDSIIQAGAARLRPIILTSITTILGLLPMTLGLFGVDDFMRPMAMAIVWGLTFSTVLTLVIIPCVYCVFDDFAAFMWAPLGMDREAWKKTKKARREEKKKTAARPLVPEPIEG